jgi:hypothetical protein
MTFENEMAFYESAALKFSKPLKTCKKLAFSLERAKKVTRNKGVCR